MELNKSTDNNKKEKIENKYKIKNIVIYRDSVNERQMNLIKEGEINQIIEGINKANSYITKKLKLEILKETKWCLILVSKFNEIKMFLNNHQNNYEINQPYIENINVGTVVDRTITSKDKYDFYLNSAESRQGTCSSTHYIVLHDNTDLTAMQIYKLTYYLTYLNYNTTKSIKVPAPLYFVMRRNQFTSVNLKNEIINKDLKRLNISL